MLCYTFCLEGLSMQTRKVADFIISWLIDYAQKAGVSGFVVGVSGGIDSAAVSTLCAHTGLSVLLLNMPIRQKVEQFNRAAQHITHLTTCYPNVSGITVDLTPTFEQFKQTVRTSQILATHDLAMANTRSRLRMTTLYYYGQIHGLLVAGTGNKVEDFGVGFFTKYGDGGVDLSPIGDLLKTQVYELAHYLQVSPSIINAVPTDGLWDIERTDEAQMGASYPELEWAMTQYAQGALAEQFTGRQREVFDIFVKLNHAAQHKIRPIPVCVLPQEYLI